MSTTIPSAMAAALLTAACLTAHADPSTQQNRSSTLSESTADDASGFIQAVGRNGSHSMHPNAPIAAGQFADDDAFGYIQPAGRNGSHSMHPDAPVPGEQFVDDDVKLLQQTGSE
ncbi:hypothetical protein K9857_00440 [Pseudomonas sp. REP124]|uniref:hypothetical protein n=1 Tax=Pseudomonas sp. REP124 TaxID=2875731 RepID=UPI001CCF1CF2|nr:hypothetical protein [Pseudomonas sp. REP124]MBZ9780019.1 hypothetical protein [Pseudomonas sp. REP124]